MPLAIPTTSNPLPAKLGAYPRARLLQITNFRSDGSNAVKSACTGNCSKSVGWIGPNSQCNSVDQIAAAPVVVDPPDKGITNPRLASNGRDSCGIRSEWNRHHQSQ